MTRREALEYFREELKDGKCSDTCPICNANEWAIKALEEPTLTTAGEPMTFGVTGIAKGKWLRPEDSTRKSYIWRCSVCRSKCYFVSGTGKCGYKYCPNCGVEMEKTDG